jgi:hypothetical protein
VVQSDDAKYFNVERLDAAGTNGWQTIGNTNSQKSASGYSFTDATVSNTGSYVYRIKEFTGNGSIYFSTEVPVRMQGSGKMDVTGFYPNPARDVLNYYVSAAQNDKVTVTTTAANGKVLLVQQAVANQPLKINVANLASGVYFISFANQNTGEKTVKRVVKN